jgi:hypothetical protein
MPTTGLPEPFVTVAVIMLEPSSTTDVVLAVKFIWYPGVEADSAVLVITTAPEELYPPESTKA